MVEIALTPERIALLRRQRLSGKVLQSKVVSCISEDANAPLWQPALAALQRTLAEPIWQRARVNVIISNHFVRYALAAGARGVSSAAEEAALVMHRFTVIFGPVAQGWTIRTSPAGADRLVAAAIDQAMLDGISELARVADLKLMSLQPLLMAAFNRLRGRLPREPFWYVMLEPGRTCLAGFDGGDWRLLEAHRGGSDPAADLPRLIEQTALTNDNSIDSRTVLIDAPHLKRVEVGKTGSWQLVDGRTLQRGSDSSLHVMNLALN